jgi:hypothetical protein
MKRKNFHTKRKVLQIVAEAIVQTGYGTDWYDPDTNECHHSAYASIEKVISGDWKEYDESLSSALFNDFNLVADFGVYLIRKYADGSRRFMPVDWDYKNDCIRKEKYE